MPDRPQYRVYMNDELLSATDWPPVAVAAWHRATHDTAAGREGGIVVLQKDERVIASVGNSSFSGRRWPDGPEPDLNDLAAALQQLTRAAGVDVKALADAATAMGLPTTRGRLDSIRARNKADKSQTNPAELIVLCYAAISAIRGGADK